MLNIDKIINACNSIDTAISKPVEDVEKQNTEIRANLDIIVDEVTELPDNYVYICQKGEKEEIAKQFYISYVDNENNVVILNLTNDEDEVYILIHALYGIIARMGMENFEKIFELTIKKLVKDGYIEEKEGAENE